MVRRRRGGNNVTPYSRDYRRPPRWGMGLPPRRPPSRIARFALRLRDPVFYLRAVMVLGTLALIGLPLMADGVNAALKTVRNGDGSCRVLTVVDGDTISVWCSDRGVERVRLKGFDAPELFSPRCASELLAAQQASWALRGLIFGAETLQIGFEGRDRYDRALATLRLDGASVARAMIAGHHARAYSGGHRDGWCGAGAPADASAGDG